MGKYDRTIRVAMWLDAFLSAAVALLCVVAAPAVALLGLPHRALLGVGLGALAGAVLLATFGAITAVAFLLRVHAGDWSVPPDLRLPLPRQFRPGTIAGPTWRRPRPR